MEFIRLFYLLLLTWPSIECAKQYNILDSRRKYPPKIWGNDTSPLDVHIGFYLESLGNFQNTEMAFDVDLYLYLSWRDPSLTHSENYVLINDPILLDQIWLPDIYFANARTAQFHSVTVPNFNMFIEGKTGIIAYSTRVTLNVACNLNLMNYPLDRQRCIIKILSYAYIAKEMNVTWFTYRPIRYNPQIGLPEFVIKNIGHEYCNGTFDYGIMETKHRTVSDKFSCLLAIVELKRSIGYHLVQSYIPTALIVIISWVSFWIDRKAVPARVSLSFTTLLTLSTLGNGLRYALPPVSYAKAIDYWFGTCMLFVFSTLLEFAIVNSYMRKALKYELMTQNMKWFNRNCQNESNNAENDTLVHDNYRDGNQLGYEHLARNVFLYSRKGLMVDKTCRIVFPITFLLFNLAYWFYYLWMAD